MEEILDRKIKQEEAGDLQSELELDLVAYFKLLEADVLDIVEKNDDPQVILDEIDKLLK